jgi:glycosyltransferase involved in cell wall biosynthesis
VQPSLSEGLGKSIMEAMMLAKPVIATQSGGPEELIVNGSSGLIVPPKDAQALTQAIEYLIRHPEKRKEMGDNAKRRILTDFSIEAFADNMHNIFTEAVK